LAKGVLAVNGDKATVTCPWHGACFDVKTGDIEDAPSIDCLQSYKVEITGENIQIVADPSGILF
jgi:nitrite reductase/ring-hydroxylating ferredoxin subunit